MGTKEIDILNIGNVIMDILISATDKDLENLELAKGVMHLVSVEEQQRILDYFKNFDKDLEIGGSGPNVVRCASLLGNRCCLVGQVADDEFGAKYIGRVNELGMINRIGVGATGVTGSSVVLVTPDGQRTMNTCLGNSCTYTLTDEALEDITASKYLFLTGYQWDTEQQIAAMERALSTAKSHGVRVVFDLADPFAVKRSMPAFKAVIENFADIVFANEDEARMMYEAGPEDAISMLADHCDVAVVKIGSKGSLVKSHGELIHVKATAVAVVDTTAAGDMYAGGFLHGLIEGFDMRRCGEIAAACAETVIQNIGAKLPTELRERVV